MKLIITIEIKPSTKKKSPAQPKQTPSNSPKNTVIINQKQETVKPLLTFMGLPEYPPRRLRGQKGKHHGKY